LPNKPNATSLPRNNGNASGNGTSGGGLPLRCPLHSVTLAAHALCAAVMALLPNVDGHCDAPS
jgi:hypothetical protein